MKIYFMKQKALDSLQAEVADNLNKYQSSSFCMDEHFINQNMPKYYFDTGIEVADYQLISGGPETDFQNAKIVFEAFKNKLNPVQASDLRLWAYLAHVQHWEYMSHRWKIDIPDEEDDEGSEEGKKSPREKMIDRVKTRYFFGDSRGKAFVRQGIARLYWSAYLTYDDTNDNPYEYTEFFLSKQDIFSSITERSYARNKILTLATLKELKKTSRTLSPRYSFVFGKTQSVWCHYCFRFLKSRAGRTTMRKVNGRSHPNPLLVKKKAVKLLSAVNNIQ